MYKLAMEYLARQRVKDHFGIIAWLQSQQRVLAELSNNLPFLFRDKDHHRAQRQRCDCSPPTMLSS